MFNLFIAFWIGCALFVICSISGSDAAGLSQSRSDSEPLPPLQPITLTNAEKVSLLKTLSIPEFRPAVVSQCSVVFSPDGSQLVGVCNQNTVPVWDVQSGQLLFSLLQQPAHVVAVAFSPDGKVLATGEFLKDIKLWDAMTGTLTDTLSLLPSPVWDLDFSPEGDKLVSASLDYYSSLDPAKRIGMLLWDLSKRESFWKDEMTEHRKRTLSVAYHPAGELIAFGTLSDGVMIINTNTGQLLKQLPISDHVGDVTFSPNGQLLAAGSDDDKIRLWSTTDYQLVGTLEGHTHYVNGVAFSPDGSLLVSGSHDRKVGIWDVQAGKPVKFLEGHQDVVLRVDVNAAGTLIASISWDGTVRLWGVVEEK